MGDFDEAFQKRLAVESWSFYGVGMFVIALRMYARITRLGIKRLQTDDWLMVLVAGLYTALITCLNNIAQGGGSNLYMPEDFDTFTPEDITERIQGSKVVVVSEQAMLNVIYVIKSCMLLMYTRMTLGLREQRAVRILAVYVAIGWLGTEIAFFTACQPFSGYWAMPPPSPQCATLEYYAIVQGTFNLSSDTLMLLIPIPLVIRMSIPWRQKLVILIIFSMGIFVILAAILTKVFNLENIWDPVYMLWYTREASIAVYVSNLPMIWPLVRQHFPNIMKTTPRTVKLPKNFYNQGGSSTRYGSGSAPRTGGSSFMHKMSNSILGGTRDGNMTNLDSSDELDFITTHPAGRNSSAERINPPPAAAQRNIWSHGITKSTTVQVTEEQLYRLSQGDIPDSEGRTRWDWNHDGGNAYAAGATGGDARAIKERESLSSMRAKVLSSAGHIDRPPTATVKGSHRGEAF